MYGKNNRSNEIYVSFIIWSFVSQASYTTPNPSVVFFYITIYFLNKMDNQVHDQKPSLTELKLNVSF